MYKGAKKESIEITAAKEVDAGDEIKIFVKGRVLCAMDAMWRVLGFHTYPAPSPPVTTIKVQTPTQTKELIAKSLCSDMMLYYARPRTPEFDAMKYTEFNQHFHTGVKLPARYANNPDLNNVDYWEVQIPMRRKTVTRFIWKPCDGQRIIVRMAMLYITCGEPYYLRLILLKSPVRDEQDALTLYENGEVVLNDDGTPKTFKTYQECAIARGYFHNLNEMMETFLEMTIDSTPNELRGYFVTMLINGCPMMPIYNNPNSKEFMMADFLVDIRDPATCEQRLLEDFQRRLQKDNKSLDMYGFPVPVDLSTELQREEWLWLGAAMVHEQQQLLINLNTSEPNNVLQEATFQSIMAAIANFIARPDADILDHEFHFIHGPGGSGKTALFKKIHAACRAMKQLITVCSATTLAALLYKYGLTAHSTFKYPVTEDEDWDDTCLPECKLDGTERMAYLEQVTVIFWDEFPSNDRALIEAAIRAFPTKKFLWVCAGDLNQTLPVVKNGTKQDILARTVTSSPLWNKFHIHHLTENMRLSGLLKRLREHADQLTAEERQHITDQVNYADFLNCLRSNEHSKDHCEHIHEVDADVFKLGLPKMSYILSDNDNVAEAIEWMHPNGDFSDATVQNTVILCATNEAVDKWNAIRQGLNPNPVHHYLSKDSFDEVDDPHGILRRMLNDDLLNTMNSNGVPPHTLLFKVGDVCLITRAIHGIDVANNTRVRILSCNPHTIKVLTLNEETQRIIKLPRIVFKFRLHYGDSYQVTRLQFPLRLAYAMTYNKRYSYTALSVSLSLSYSFFLSHSYANCCLFYTNKTVNRRLCIGFFWIAPPNPLLTDNYTSPHQESVIVTTFACF